MGQIPDDRVRILQSNDSTNKQGYITRTLATVQRRRRRGYSVIELVCRISLGRAVAYTGFTWEWCICGSRWEERSGLEGMKASELICIT